MFSSRLEDILKIIASFNAGNFSASLANLQQVLKKLKIVRLLMYPGPGMGHQASTFHVLMRIIDLGFRGTAELYYHESNAAIVARLLPNFDPRVPEKPIPLAGATVQPKAFNKLPLTADEVELGFSGGVDWEYLENPNLAIQLKVKYFLGLQPYRWIMRNVIQAPDLPADQIILDDRPHPGVFRKRAFYQEAPAMTDDDYARFARSEQKAKLAPYKAMVAAVQARSLHLMPVYGIEMFEQEYKEKHPEVDSPATSEMILFNLLTGILHAQDGLQQFNSVALVVLANLTDQPNAGTYHRLNELLKGTSASIGQGSKLARFIAANGQKFDERVKIVSFDAATFDQDLAATAREKNQVLIVKMGALPLAAFNYLYRLGDLPGVFEGQGTANLLLNLGQPYFQLPSHNNQVNESHADLYPTLPLTAQPGDRAREMLTVVRLVLATAQQWNGATAIDVVIGNTLMITIIGGHTPYMNYFSDLGAFFHAPAEDKFLQGAFYFFDFIQGRVRQGRSAFSTPTLQQLFQPSPQAPMSPR